MGASINRGPQNRHKYIMVLIIGATKMGPLILTTTHMRMIQGPRRRASRPCLRNVDHGSYGNPSAQ